MIGHTFGKPVEPIRRFFILNIGKILVRIKIISIGIYSINWEKPDIDYKKWLGPDWKPSYENAGTIISNHGSWMVNIL